MDDRARRSRRVQALRDLNLCRPGFSSRHNTKYWTGAPISASVVRRTRLTPARRWSNQRDVLRYVENVEQGVSPIVEEQELTDADRAEALFLGMRMMRGVDVREYNELFGVDLRAEHADELDRFREAGLVEFDGDLIRLTRNGALMSNEVFAAFV